MNRANLLEVLTGRITAVVRPHPVRVAIDGVDGVGKTTLADELVEPIRRRGRSVIRGSIDRFHHPRRVRYARGRSSPEGYFLDSFNNDALIGSLLRPLGPGGSRRYRSAVFDYRTDSDVGVPEELASSDAVLLFDGVFLHRPELRPYWDFSVFLDAPFDVTIARYAARDGAPSDVDAPENRRYVEGQRLYLRTCEPEKRATMVVRNEDLEDPVIVLNSVS